MNHNKSVVLRSDTLSKALTLPRLIVGPSTTSLPKSIGRLLSLAICKYQKRFSNILFFSNFQKLLKVFICIFICTNYIYYNNHLCQLAGKVPKLN